MDKAIHPASTSGNLFLTCCLLLAGIDVSSLLHYSLKAVLAGTLWLGFKLLRPRLLKKRGQNPVSPLRDERA